MKIQTYYILVPILCVYVCIHIAPIKQNTYISDPKSIPLLFKNTINESLYKLYLGQYHVR